MPSSSPAKEAVHSDRSRQEYGISSGMAGTEGLQWKGQEEPDRDRKTGVQGACFGVGQPPLIFFAAPARISPIPDTVWLGTQTVIGVPRLERPRHSRLPRFCAQSRLRPSSIHLPTETPTRFLIGSSVPYP